MSPADLNDIEIATLKLSAAGLSMQEIAREVGGISPHGVRHRLTSATRKLGAVNLINAVHLAHVRGLFSKAA